MLGTCNAPTVAELLARAARTLSGASESPRLDAELLLCKVTGLSRSALIVRGAAPLAAAHRAAFDALLARRCDGAPVAYLTGVREFWSLRVSVTTDVLVPRPETELLVEQALTLLPERGSLLDLGTGSGAVALAVAADRPRVRITAVDISAAALSVARRNADELGLPPIDWRLGSWFDALGDARFDVIVANPPYVAAGDPALERLTAEPLLALSPGPTGLEALTVIVAGAAAYLEPQGWLLLEHGSDQGDAVARMLSEAGFSRVQTCPDFAGHPRVTLGAAPGAAHGAAHSSHHSS